MNKRFELIPTPISGLHIVQRKPIVDNRGHLERLFCADELRGILDHKNIAQINHTLTVKCGTVRGLHFQYPPHSEIKLVTCLRGKVFDVAVDLRKNSPTFLHWHSEILSDSNNKTFLIPEGFAHGFQSLCENCEMLYFHTKAYYPHSEGGLNAKDPILDIHWPLSISDQSPRDMAHPILTPDFTGVTL